MTGMVYIPCAIEQIIGFCSFEGCSKQGVQFKVLQNKSVVASWLVKLGC